MPLLVATNENKTVITYPGEPALDELHRAETMRTSADDAWWSHLTGTFVLLACIGAYALAGGSDRDLLRTCLLCIVGQLAGRLWGRSMARRRHARAHAGFLAATKDDPSWKDSR